MPLSDTVKTLIRNAWDDGYPCLVATVGPQGPNLTPKGSMIVYDDAHLAWWERSKRAVLDNLGHDKRVCIMYANFKAQRDGVLELGFLRFFGTVELHESGPVRDRIFSLLLPREQTHVGADAGIGALVKNRQGDRRARQVDHVIAPFRRFLSFSARLRLRRFEHEIRRIAARPAPMLPRVRLRFAAGSRGVRANCLRFSAYFFR